jgi:hypothetical protein
MIWEYELFFNIKKEYIISDTMLIFFKKQNKNLNQTFIYPYPHLSYNMDKSTQKAEEKSQKLCTFLCTLNKKPL